jgi:hypothetical protein
MQGLQTLVDAADPAALLVAVDRLCAAREWAALVDLAGRCRAAVELGRQLWPVATHIDYRLAWEGPASYAAAVLVPGAGRFALGPLTEVAASTHEWDALAPHLSDPATAGAVAQERVLRGEDLRGRSGPAELPLAPESWEPAYALPRYRDRSAAFPAPEIAAAAVPAAALPPAPAPLPPDDATAALETTVETWTTQSTGSAHAVAVEGDAAAAVATLGGTGLVEVTAADGLALLQWAGASGGAYGRRPGGARGRFAAWFAAAALAGLDWPVEGGELGAAVAELRWFRWSAGTGETGWVLRLAVDDPVDGLAWAVDASDHRADEDGPA